MRREGSVSSCQRGGKSRSTPPCGRAAIPSARHPPPPREREWWWWSKRVESAEAVGRASKKKEKARPFSSTHVRHASSSLVKSVALATVPVTGSARGVAGRRAGRRAADRRPAVSGRADGRRAGVDRISSLKYVLCGEMKEWVDCVLVWGSEREGGGVVGVRGVTL